MLPSLSAENRFHEEARKRGSPGQPERLSEAGRESVWKGVRGPSALAQCQRLKGDGSPGSLPLGGGGVGFSCQPRGGGGRLFCQVTEGWSGKLGASGPASQGCPKGTSLAAEEYRSGTRGESSLPPQTLTPPPRCACLGLLSECSSFLPPQVEPRRCSPVPFLEAPPASRATPTGGPLQLSPPPFRTPCGLMKREPSGKFGCPGKQVPWVAGSQQASGGCSVGLVHQAS